MKIQTLAVILTLCFVTAAQAIESKDHEFKVGLEISHIAYEEPDFDVKENGPFFGVYANYAYRPQWIINYFGVDAHVNYGVVDYEGSGEINDIDDYLLEPRLLVGRSVDLSQNIRVMPYGGFGYRHLYDAVGSMISSTGAIGYDRRSQYIYVPLGITVDYDLNHRWALAVNTEYDLFLKGWQDSYLSDVSPYSDLKNTQDKGYGLRGSVDIKYKAENVNYVVSPYVRYWHVEDSNAASSSYNGVVQFYGFEPKNTSLEIGARLGVEF